METNYSNELLGLSASEVSSKTPALYLNKQNKHTRQKTVSLLYT